MNKLNKTQTYFIEIIKNYISNRKTPIDKEVDYKALFGISRLQNLSAIIYDALKENIPESFKNSFKNDYDYTIFNNANRHYLISIIDKTFKENNIPYFIVKGTKLAELYPNPLLRTMGDTDMVLHSTDRIKADDLMINKLDFEKLANGNEWIYLKNKCEFELHDSLLYEDYKEKDYLNNFWDYVYKKEDGTYELDYSFHFIFLIAHLKKHILFEGAGFRQFIDIGLVCKKKQLDWDHISRVLNDLSLLEFAKTVLSLNNIWFDIVNPLGNKELSNNFIEETTLKILEFGVFGHNNPDSQTNKMLNKGDSKIKFIINSIFPSRKVLFTHLYMKWFIDKPLLLPLAYVYRLIYIFKTRFKDIIKVLFVSKDTLNKRNDELKNWGLKQ